MIFYVSYSLYLPVSKQNCGEVTTRQPICFRTEYDVGGDILSN